MELEDWQYPPLPVPAEGWVEEEDDAYEYDDGMYDCGCCSCCGCSCFDDDDIWDYDEDED